MVDVSDINELLEGMDTEAKIALLKSLQKEKKELNKSLKEDKQEIADQLWAAAGTRLQEYFDGPLGSFSFNAEVKHPSSGEAEKVQFIIKPAKSSKKKAEGNGSDESGSDTETETETSE